MTWCKILLDNIFITNVSYENQKNAIFNIFQTRSRACLKNAFREMCFTLGGEFIPNL